MGVFSGMFPILAGKEDVTRALARDVAGPRKDGFDALQQRGDITRETWALQATPAGSFMLVWFEGNVDKAFEDLATDQDDFTVWLRAQLQEITGEDLTKPEEGPPPEMVLDWRA
jgi:hypothetical protein